MKHVIILTVASLTVSGCAGVNMNNLLPKPQHLQDNAPMTATVPDDTGPVAPPENATTVDQFDTATEEEKVAAVAPAAAPAGALGTTVANLGDPTLPGFWVETPLVSSEVEGRVQSKSTGRTVKVTLKPTSSGGSRISLSALQLLDLDLSGLHELVVFGS